MYIKWIILSQVVIAWNFIQSNIYTNFNWNRRVCFFLHRIAIYAYHGHIYIHNVYLSQLIISTEKVEYIKMFESCEWWMYQWSVTTHTSTRIQSICCSRLWSIRLNNAVCSLKCDHALHMQFKGVNNSGLYVHQKHIICIYMMKIIRGIG